MVEASDNVTKPPVPRRRGFSLVELLIVVAVMGILAGLLLPSFEPSIHDKLDAAAEIVAADLAYARHLAVNNDSSYRITFDNGNDSYTLEHSGANASLDTLPASPFRESNDTATTQSTDFKELPAIGSPLELVGVHKMTPSAADVTDLEFGSLGSTTRSEETMIWLGCGAGDGRLYISITVDPVTGLTEIGEVQATAPPAGS